MALYWWKRNGFIATKTAATYNINELQYIKNVFHIY